jgi:hypothetical protein
LNESSYTDEQGNSFDNTIDHVALTNKAFFSPQTAVFSSDAKLMKDGDVIEKLQTEVDELKEQFREFDTEQRKKLAASGAAMDDGSYPIENTGDVSNAIQAIGRAKNPATAKAHIIKRAKALGATSQLPEDWKDTMSEKTETQTDVKTISVEDFAALEAKVKEFDKTMADATKKVADEFAAKLDAEKKRADEFAVQVAAERKTRVLSELTHAATEKFAHLPVKADEYATNFYAISETSPEAAKWFAAKFEELDTLVSQNALFTQFSRQHADPTVETLETVTDKILKEQFSGDMKNYTKAFSAAGKARPDLMAKYHATYTGPAPRQTD